ncbi:hypothetical protein EV644_102642 [Kribbella orskensis]|uniref:Prenyltransferase/squalene oxidase-like repeat protein n=1 Tax=Kribbella orskensis TaxID=2512216 RepID=A0ABY2BTD7_9ACTN|nr:MULTISPECIES: hypothetical protein [Kribbella]TCN42723.1 hypothetical protein EV642_10295 [Kribbella sp. VKM Ac-2500]TCO29921.1 hypothetical protein EV644_102642 [Kribbella orskensis]
MDGGVEWLLESEEPAVRGMARRDLLGEEFGEDVLVGAKVRALLDAPSEKHPYKKWTGAHWRIVSMVELEVPPGEPRAMAAADEVLEMITRAHRYDVPVVNGLPRSHGSIEGNAVAACSLLGLADDPRTQEIVQALLDWQWPDGGWNCDKNPGAHRSSFHETHSAAWGLHEYWRATGDQAARDAAVRAGELFLEHRVFRSLTTGEVINKRWLQPSYPPYWHYDILQALLVLSRLGLAKDPRAMDALDLLEQQRLPDGRWKVRLQWWKPAGGTSAQEVVDWGRSGPNEMVTLNALRVLKAAGR